jgi:Glycosyl transferases group 1
MKAVVLTPYCPWPADSGAKIEMLKHLSILKELGECHLASATSLPVGRGWDQASQSIARDKGYNLIFREDTLRRLSMAMILGVLYACAVKGLRLNRAFGHANPYHRHAFPASWWKDVTRDAQLAVINYSYWAWLPTKVPKVVILHDLLSEIMWGGDHLEIADLRKADLVVVISQDEEAVLRAKGVEQTLWSPPLVSPLEAALNNSVGLVGSGNAFNIEGLRWLQAVEAFREVQLTLYGGVAKYAQGPWQSVSSYADQYTPYRECGIFLLPTAMGTGVQIKAIEALACGRVIIARKGAMRGLPPGQDAWIEVSSPVEMLQRLHDVQKDDELLFKQGERARKYYNTYLDSCHVKERLTQAYVNILEKNKLVNGFSSYP